MLFQPLQSSNVTVSFVWKSRVLVTATECASRQFVLNKLFRLDVLCLLIWVGSLVSLEVRVIALMK